MKKIVPLLFIVFFCNEMYAQGKLILRNGMKRAVIKPGKEIGVTRKGEIYHFTNWTTACMPCKKVDCVDSLRRENVITDTIRYFNATCIDSACYENRWILDSVKTDCIVVRRFPIDSAQLRFDTVLARDVSNYLDIIVEQKKELYWLVDIPPRAGSRDEMKSVFMVVISYDRLRIPLDSIESFTFPKDEQCVRDRNGFSWISLGAMVVAPFAAIDKGKMQWGVFAILETSASAFFVGSLVSRDNNDVKRYATNEWKVKTR